MTQRQSDTTGATEREGQSSSGRLAADRTRGFVERLRDGVMKHGRSGMLALGVGAVAMLRALQLHQQDRDGVRSTAAAGALWLGVGVLQHRANAQQTSEDDRVSADAHAAGRRPKSGRKRMPSESPGTESAPADDEGAVTFTHDGEETAGTAPTSDGDEQDPRLDDGGDVEVDISTANIADEASEAAGPEPEQAQPAQTEDTEPEVSPPEDASHMQVDADEETDTGGKDVEMVDGDVDEGVEAEGGEDEDIGEDVEISGIDDGDMDEGSIDEEDIKVDDAGEEDIDAGGADEMDTSDESDELDAAARDVLEREERE